MKTALKLNPIRGYNYIEHIENYYRKNPNQVKYHENKVSVLVFAYRPLFYGWSHAGSGQAVSQRISAKRRQTAGRAV
ncbi:hypothetical protein PbJCM13498_02620 [Prolixibacter bellariivorans]|uniref:Uncharacterized protein n=1 Tax=Prolixibacter bellariivorans TaxID=314319 RepID=A0A5M4ATY1_9BACT|nr:hypothetical protein PbJCM13498_02620 [Prolixibacter bellariivorans]